MAAKRRNIGRELETALENAIAFSRGDKTKGRIHVVVPREINVRAIRRKLGMSQQAFASRFGFSVNTLRHWEQGGRQPEGPARAYLTVIARNPKAVERALSAA